MTPVFRTSQNFDIQFAKRRKLKRNKNLACITKRFHNIPKAFIGKTSTSVKSKFPVRFPQNKSRVIKWTTMKQICSESVFSELSVSVGEREENNNPPPQKKMEMADWWKAKLVPGRHVLLLSTILKTPTRFRRRAELALPGCTVSCRNDSFVSSW